MSARSTPTVPTPTPDQRRIAAENFDRARQVIQTGNHDYGIDLLRTCCRIEPGNFKYRQALRKAQKEKYGNNLRGSTLAFISSGQNKARMKAARAGRDHLKVLEYGEDILAKNPWDAGTQMDMADAFDALGLVDLAVFTLDQARQKHPNDPTVNRALARLFEKRGDFKQAIALWQLVREAVPTDVEAGHKAKDLAASDTIARGGYQQVADGSRTSPALGNMETAALEKQDKLTRDAGPLLKRIEADPTEPTLYVQLAAIFRRHHQEDRAKAVLTQGLGPTGNHFSLQLELTELELEPFRKNLEIADARIKEAKAKHETGDDLDDGPSIEELAGTRSKLVKEIANRELEILRTKAERFPNELIHRLDFGARLLKADRVDEAIAELQIARRDEKLKGRAAMYLGACFRKRNNWRLAMRNFEDALASLPASDEKARKEVLFQLATGCAENDDLPRALDLGHELANLDFNYKGIGNLLDDWQTRLQRA